LLQCIFAEPLTLDARAVILSHACSYDEKVDIFALALVLYELLHPFRTNMERVRTLQNLRKNVIPQEAREAWPEASELITQMMSRNPKVRPLQNVSARVSVAREVAATVQISRISLSVTEGMDAGEALGRGRAAAPDVCGEEGRGVHGNRARAKEPADSATAGPNPELAICRRQASDIGSLENRTERKLLQRF
jgi:hypothetical protein